MSTPKEHQQDLSEKSGTVTLKLRADNGYERDAEFRICALQWGKILAVCADIGGKYSNSGEPS